MGARSPYLVEVNQPFHLSGEDERYEVGAYDRCEEARDACREIVEEFLASRKGAATSPEELFELYRDQGPEPFIVNRDGESGGPCSFSAATWAEQRCRELFESEGGAGGRREDGEPPAI